MTQPKVVFIHVPKTAGTTLLELLRTLCKPEAYLPTRFWDNVTPELAEQAPSFQICAGHFYLNWQFNMDRFPEHRFITVLREPRDQAISTFFERVRYPDSCTPEQHEAISLGLEETLLQNKFGCFLDTALMHLSSLPMTCLPYGNARHLRSAKANLERFFAVGFMADFAHFTRNLFTRLGRPLTTDVPHYNANPAKPRLVLLSKAAQNRLDYILEQECLFYEWAFSTFAQDRLKTFGPS